MRDRVEIRIKLDVGRLPTDREMAARDLVTIVIKALKMRIFPLKGIDDPQGLILRPRPLASLFSEPSHELVIGILKRRK